MKNTSLRLPLFILLGWISAFIFEEVPRTILQHLPNIKHLWELGQGWHIFFLIWYGIVFLLFYLLFIKRSLQHPIVYGIIFGLLVETFYFKEMRNIISFVLFIPSYAGLFYLPLKVHKRIWEKEKMNRKELRKVIIYAILTLAFLIFLAIVAKR